MEKAGWRKTLIKLIWKFFENDSATISLKKKLLSLSFNSNESYLAAATYGKIKIWDVTNIKCLLKLKIKVNLLIFCPKNHNRLFVLTKTNNIQIYRLNISDINSNLIEIASLNQIENQILNFIVSFDGRRVISTNQKSEIIIWKQVKKRNDYTSNNLDFSLEFDNLSDSEFEFLVERILSKNPTMFTSFKTTFENNIFDSDNQKKFLSQQGAII